MPEVADIPEVSVQPATEQPQQTIETKTETQPIITKESRMGNRIRDILKRFGGNNPHKTLQEIAGAEEPPAEPSAQEHEQGEDVANTETDPATPVNVEPIPEVFEKSLAGSDFDPKNPTPAAIEKNDTQVESEDEEPTIEELKQMDWWEAQRRIGEVVERRNKKNEVKYRIDSIHHDMFTLGKDRYDVELRSFVEEKVKEGVDWLVENPNRAQEAISYMHDQEDILSHARSLPNKTNTEREYIDMMENNLNKIRIELSNRGISIPDKENDAELSVPEIEDNPPIVVDPETAFEYAYHATPLRNIRSIAEDGLQPSGIDSKEIGTIFFNAYDQATGYLPSLGVIFRVLVEKIPPDANGQMGDLENGKYILPGGPVATSSAISVENLEFSLDAGQTWRRRMEVFRKTTDNVTAN